MKISFRQGLEGEVEVYTQNDPPPELSHIPSSHLPYLLLIFHSNPENIDFFYRSAYSDLSTSSLFVEDRIIITFTNKAKILQILEVIQQDIDWTQNEEFILRFKQLETNIFEKLRHQQPLNSKLFTNYLASSASLSRNLGINLSARYDPLNQKVKELLQLRETAVSDEKDGPHIPPSVC